ncbi:unnamed protein product, partial [Ectocarpus sp. 12 AP-2014]
TRRTTKTRYSVPSWFPLLLSACRKIRNRAAGKPISSPGIYPTVAALQPND